MSSPLSSPQDDRWLRRLFLDVKTIAVVGLSHDETKPSFLVASYLKRNGYRVIPVNPKPGIVLGEATYPDLGSIPIPVDLIDVFRRPDGCPEIVRQALPLRPKAIWLQLGIESEEAEAIAREAGIPLVMNRCTKIDHQRLLGEKLIDPSTI